MESRKYIESIRFCIFSNRASFSQSSSIKCLNNSEQPCLSNLVWIFDFSKDETWILSFTNNTGIISNNLFRILFEGQIMHEIIRSR